MTASLCMRIHMCVVRLAVIAIGTLSLLWLSWVCLGLFLLVPCYLIVVVVAAAVVVVVV